MSDTEKFLLVAMTEAHVQDRIHEKNIAGRVIAQLANMHHEEFAAIYNCIDDRVGDAAVRWVGKQYHELRNMY